MILFPGRVSPDARPGLPRWPNGWRGIYSPKFGEAPLKILSDAEGPNGREFVFLAFGRGPIEATTMAKLKIKVAAGRLGGAAPHARRTHWTAGKPRNPDSDPAEVTELLRELGRHLLIADTCRRIGVARKTAHRWQIGETRPSAKHLAGLRAAVKRIGTNS